MRILVVCNEDQEKEFLSGIERKNNLTFAANLPGKNALKNYDAYFILSKTNPSLNFNLFENKPVFLNEVIETLSGLNYPKNFSRINGWPGFLKRETWEIVSNDIGISETVFKQIGLKIIPVKDEPGLVAARVISMIINEAYFSVGEKISSRNEIDMAMKLGTNYPYGPFEWAEKIGIENIYYLLQTLAKKEERYLPAEELKNDFLKKKEKTDELYSKY